MQDDATSILYMTRWCSTGHWSSLTPQTSGPSHQITSINRLFRTQNGHNFQCVYTTLINKDLLDTKIIVSCSYNFWGGEFQLRLLLTISNPSSSSCRLGDISRPLSRPGERSDPLQPPLSSTLKPPPPSPSRSRHLSPPPPPSLSLHPPPSPPCPQPRPPSRSDLLS